MENIFTIIRKKFPKTVLKMKVKDLDKNRCSSKFVAHMDKLNQESEVFVKCNEDGSIDYRGKKMEYRLYDISKHDLILA